MRTRHGVVTAIGASPGDPVTVNLDGVDVVMPQRKNGVLAVNDVATVLQEGRVMVALGPTAQQTALISGEVWAVVYFYRARVNSQYLEEPGGLIDSYGNFWDRRVGTAGKQAVAFSGIYTLGLFYGTITTPIDFADVTFTLARENGAVISDYSPGYSPVNIGVAEYAPVASVSGSSGGFSTSVSGTVSPDWNFMSVGYGGTAGGSVTPDLDLLAYMTPTVEGVTIHLGLWQLTPPPPAGSTVTLYGGPSSGFWFGGWS